MTLVRRQRERFGRIIALNVQSDGHAQSEAGGAGDGIPTDGNRKPVRINATHDRPVGQIKRCRGRQRVVVVVGDAHPTVLAQIAIFVNRRVHAGCVDRRHAVVAARGELAGFGRVQVENADVLAVIGPHHQVHFATQPVAILRANFPLATTEVGDVERRTAEISG